MNEKYVSTLTYARHAVKHQHHFTTVRVLISPRQKITRSKRLERDGLCVWGGVARRGYQYQCE